MITLATWNINSIKARLPLVTDWLARVQPDMLLLQEIKCKTDAFPTQHFADLGYHAQVLGQPAYNGVAILSRQPASLVTTTLVPDDPLARFMDVAWGDMRVINIYAPNGNPVDSPKFPYKLDWLIQLETYVQRLLADHVPFIVAGDFNIIPEALDAHHPDAWVNDALYQPQSRAAWRRLCHLGLVDAFRAKHGNMPHAYTFWDYQAGAWPRDNGIRIDHALLSPVLADRLHDVWIDKDPRGLEKPSDHTPLCVRIL